MLIDEPRVSGRHARIEIVPCDGGSKCNQDYRWAHKCRVEGGSRIIFCGLCWLENTQKPDFVTCLFKVAL